MNFEPPDGYQNISLPKRKFNSQNQGNRMYQSPLRSNNETQTTSSQNRYNGVHNRLGNKNMYRNNNKVNNATSEENHGNINFNRKRVGEPGTGPIPAKRKWNNNRPPYYKNNMNRTNLAQNRLNRIRNSNQHLNIKEENDTTDSFNPQFEVNNVGANDSQELDATDITVEVVNHNAVVAQEDTNPSRFKMVLDPVMQKAIRQIQSKQREKQVIFPFPVTPNITAISLHERFSML